MSNFKKYVEFSVGDTEDTLNTCLYLDTDTNEQCILNIISNYFKSFSNVVGSPKYVTIDVGVKPDSLISGEIIMVNTLLTKDELLKKGFSFCERLSAELPSFEEYRKEK